MSKRIICSLFTLSMAAGCSAADTADRAPEGALAEAESALYPDTTTLWPTTLIPVCWESMSFGNIVERGWVRQAVTSQWEAASAVDFIGWQHCEDDAAGIRIAISDEGPHTDGLGTSIDGVSGGMVMNFTFQNWSPDCQADSVRRDCIENIAVHEFGHALGFAHEQNRPDTPSWCDEEQGSDGNITFGDWDLDSVMNYCNPEWSGDGTLSDTDILGVRKYYGGVFWKMYSSAAVGPDFNYQQQVGGLKGRIIPADFNGDGKSDAVVLRSRDGAFSRRYGDAGGISPDFSSIQPERFIGGSRYALPGAQLLPADFNGDGRSDILVFRASDGYFGKWYSDGSTSPDFTYTAARYVGGSPYAASGFLNPVTMIRGDWNGDGRIDILAFRPSDGAFWKWYSGSSVDADFTYQPVRYIGGAPYALPDAKMVAGDWNGDGKTDIVVYRESDGYFGKWYSSGAIGPDFTYTAARYIGGAPSSLPGAQMIAGDWNGDGRTDIVVFRPSDGYFGKWYSDGAIGPDFTYTAARYIGGAPYSLPGASLIPGDWDGDGRTDIMVFRSSDGYFGKWYSGSAISADFTYTAARYLGGAPYTVSGAVAVPADWNGDGRTDITIFRPGKGN